MEIDNWIVKIIIVFLIILSVILGIYIQIALPCNSWIFKMATLKEIPARCLTLFIGK